MLRNVAIVSAHQTKFDGNKADERFQEMCWPLVKKCIGETGLVFVPGRGIDFAITCSDDFFDQRTISDGPMGDLVGAGRWGTRMGSAVVEPLFGFRAIEYRETTGPIRC